MTYVEGLIRKVSGLCVSLAIGVGLLPFYIHRFFKFNLNLVAAESRILKQSVELDVRQEY